MPPSRRLVDLEELLKTNYQKLTKFQNRLDRTASVREEFDIEGDIPKIRKAIRDYEAEYWEVLAQEARNCAVEEVEAQKAIVEVVHEIEIMENNPDANYPAQLLNLLQQIRDNLNKPETPVEGKVKLVLNLLPGVITYEVELDTEKALRKVKEPIKRLFREAIEKKK